MKRLLNIFHPLITVLLLLQFSVAYALPEDIHLNLCFGADGRVGISPNLCADELPGQEIDAAHLFILTDSSHGDCLEFVLGCLSSGEFRLTTSVKSPVVKKSDRHRTNSIYFSGIMAASGILPPPALPRPDIPAEISLYKQISSIRTVVLQI